MVPTQNTLWGNNKIFFCGVMLSLPHPLLEPQWHLMEKDRKGHSWLRTVMEPGTSHEGYEQWETVSDSFEVSPSGLRNCRVLLGREGRVPPLRGAVWITGSEQSRLFCWEHEWPLQTRSPDRCPEVTTLGSQHPAAGSCAGGGGRAGKKARSWPVLPNLGA